MSLRSKEMQIPYLVAQHCHEILLVESDYHAVVEKSFSVEFLDMLYTCVLIPFIHRDTPKTSNLPKSTDRELAQTRHCWLPDSDQLEEYFMLLAKIGLK